MLHFLGCAVLSWLPSVLAWLDGVGKQFASLIAGENLQGLFHASNLILAQLLADNPLFILGGASFLGLIEELNVSLLLSFSITVESVVADLVHVTTIGHNAVLNLVLQGEHTTLALGLITAVTVLLIQTTKRLWSVNDG